MDTTLLSIGREAILVALLASTPPLAAALLAGLVTGVFQAATQIQDVSLGVAPRLAAVLATLLVTGPFVSARIARFAKTCIDLVPWGAG